MPEAFGPLNIIVTILIAVVIQEWTDENTLAAFATMLAIEELGPWEAFITVVAIMIDIIEFQLSLLHRIFEFTPWQKLLNAEQYICGKDTEPAACMYAQQNIIEWYLLRLVLNTVA